METPWALALLGIVAGPVLTFLGVWYGKRTEFKAQRLEINADATKAATETATTMVQAYYGQLKADSDRYRERIEELEQQSAKSQQANAEMADEIRSLNRRLGSLEADNARLTVENETLRKEVERLVDEVQRERAEKFELSKSLSDEQRRVIEGERQRREMQAQIDTLKAEVAELRTAVRGGQP